MADLISMLAAASGIGAEEADPNFNQTVLLLHGDGTNGAQNNTFLDSSSNNFTITRNPATGPNAPTQGTFSPFSLAAGEWSNYFPGTSFSTENRISGTVSAIGTGNFTIAFWVYVQGIVLDSSGSSPGAQNIIDGSNSVLIQVDGSNQLQVVDRVTSAVVISGSGSTAIPYREWTHVALIRSGTGSNQTKLYVNGSEVASATVSSNFTGTSMSIGSRFAVSGSSWGPLFGYISNVIYADSALSSAVPTAPYTNVSGTRLLTCQSNRFVDNSNNIALTVTSNVRVTPFSPFAPTAAYSAGTNGGSGYFDGTDDYLSNASSNALDFGSGNFTVEMWVYRIGTGSQQSFLGGTSNLPLFEMDAGNVRWQVSGTTGGAIPVGAWSHIVWVREGTGTNQCAAWLNGARVILTTDSTSYTPTSFAVGGRVGGSVLFTGYIGSLRVVKSAEHSVSSTTISVPTAPFTAITNTSLLLNFTNAGIFDNTGKNNLETVDNAQIDTAVKKFGTGSMEFDGNGDYLLSPSTPLLGIDSGDFTIECWVYFNSVSGFQCIYDLRSAQPSAAPLLYLANNSRFNYLFNSGTPVAFGPNPLVTGTWYYVAWVRSGSTHTLYVDGQSQATFTSTAGVSSSAITIGARQAGGAADWLNGFIDDLRITKGVARYPTEPFPTAAFPNE